MDISNQFFNLFSHHGMVTIQGFRASDNVLEELKVGILKRLLILWKPFGGNKLAYYDQQLRQITGALSLYNAEIVIFTNQVIELGDEIRGFKIFDRDVTITSCVSRFSILTLVVSDHAECVLCDEFSLSVLNQNQQYLGTVCLAIIS